MPDDEPQDTMRTRPRQQRRRRLVAGHDRMYSIKDAGNMDVLTINDVSLPCSHFNGLLNNGSFLLKSEDRRKCHPEMLNTALNRETWMEAAWC